MTLLWREAVAMTTLRREHTLRTLRHRPFDVIAAVVAVVLSACGDGGASSGAGRNDPPASKPSASTTVAVSEAPLPAEMCPAGEYPMVAAFDLVSGAFLWVTCSPERDMVLLDAASPDRVWATRLGNPSLLLDAHTGEQLEDRDAAVPEGADLARSSPGTVSGVVITGGQDDPLVGRDASTHTVLWSRDDGHPYYDNVWAVSDGAVYVDSFGDDRTSGIAAVEAATGEDRWRQPSAVVSASPWHATGERVFALGHDIWVLSTNDGSLYWKTAYGDAASGGPRLFGALANDTTLFVSFTMVASGGD